MRKLKPKSYDYIEKLAGAETELMQLARKNSEKLGLAAISVSRVEARLIQMQLKSISAKKVVEIGTLTGLSALYILDAIPTDGFLWTLEKSEEHAQLAAEVLASAIKNNHCQILVGDARVKLEELNSQGPFDAIFIDGNKAAYLDYFNWALAHLKVGGIIAIDNVFLSGAVWGDPTDQNFNAKQIKAVQDMNQLAFTNTKLDSYFLPTEEGLLICKKLS